MLAAEPRVAATTIQTVGGKGYDGFTIALVEGRVGHGAEMRDAPPRDIESRPLSAAAPR